ncbi:MAG: 2OG-Fe(II) oxygenase [Cyclobacteriaceae bacterium]|nr:2OG-Fe(II) oxygenase [Cyclobacteriaceae bacterium]
MIDYSQIHWPHVYQSLNDKGYAVIPSLLSVGDCEYLRNNYSRDDLYRSTITMQRYRFGKGEYKYYSYPLPPLIQSLRSNLYSALAAIANTWMNQLSKENQFPEELPKIIDQCRTKGQLRPTPLILHYETGGFNTLHQDLYGEIYFPFQVTFPLSQAGVDFEGGEFILVEQIPRAQSKAQVVALNQGDALIFTTNFRPIKGTKGYYKANMKHGVSPLRSGERYTLGIIFHDAL